MQRRPSDVTAYIDRRQQELVALLQQLIRTRSVNPWKDPTSEGEFRVAAILEQKLKALGFEVESFEVAAGRPNLIGRLRTGRPGPTLLVNAHMDTHCVEDESLWVAPPFSATIIDGVMYGRGTCDHKSPIAAMLFALEALLATGHRLGGELIYVFDSDEEGGGQLGMRHIVDRYDLSCDYALYACTTDINPESERFFSALTRSNIIRALSGRLHVVVKVCGEVHHPLAPVMDHNAVANAVRILPRLSSLCEEANRFVDPIVGTGHARMTVSYVECRPRPDRQAELCTVHLLRRVDPTEDLGRVEAGLTQELRAELLRQGVVGDVEVVDRIPPIVVAEDCPLVQELAAAAVEVTGVRPTLAGFPTPVGISQLLASRQINTVLFGYGCVNLHHAVNEHIAVGDVVNTAKVYALAIGRLMASD